MSPRVRQPRFSGPRAWEHLSHLWTRDREPGPTDFPPDDPFALAGFLARNTVAPFRQAFPWDSQHTGPECSAGATLGGRIPGRQPGPGHVLAAAYRSPPPRDAPAPAGPPPQRPWGAHADASGPALLMALIEALATAPPLYDVVAVFFGHPGQHGEPDAESASAASFAGEVLALPGQAHPQGVIVIGRVGARGLSLDVDVRCLTHPRAGALLSELFRLGRAWGYPAFSGGAELLCPGDHVPFLERGLPAVCLSDTKNALAGTQDDTLAHCDPLALEAVGDVVLGYLQGERVV